MEMMLIWPKMCAPSTYDCPSCMQGESVPGSTVIPSQTDNGLSIAVNLVILFCIYIITRLGALAALMGAARLRWL